MDYNSVQEILDAGITNMTVIRNNTKQDDGTDTVTGVDWFTFNGTVATNVYVSGNSWFGFGSSSEHLKVNRRDGALYYVYREEGTLYGYYKFLKIRWKGYSYYSQTSSSYLIEYDVILWDTGDISLHMINIPTSYNSGTYSLVASSTYSYSVSTSAMDVTFTKTDSGFTVSNSIIDLAPPFERRYLVKDGSTYYTVENNVLTTIDITELTSEVFLTYGAAQLFDISLLSTLSNPELLYWQDSDQELQNGLVINGTPPLPVIVEYEDYDISNVNGIEEMEAVGSDDALFALSFDEGSTWKYYDGTNWLTAESNNVGMAVSTIKNISATTWQQIFDVSANVLKIRSALPNVNSTTGKVYLQEITA